MKDELTRQCEMAWERGRKYGFTIGFYSALMIAGTVLALIKFISLIK